MKKTKLLALIALVAVLVMACAIAFADNGTAGNAQPSASKITLRRGQTVNILIWGNYDTNGGYGVNDSLSCDAYNLSTGADWGGSTYTLQGPSSRQSVKVTSGSSWMRVTGTVNSWNFNTKTNNASTKTRTAKIVVKDAYGTVATYKITQLPMAKMESGTYTYSKLTLKAKKMSGYSGYAFYKDWWYSYYTSVSNTTMQLIKQSSSQKITTSRPTDYRYWYYKVRPLKRLNNGRLVVGPFSKNHVWHHN